jgi:hypothetical protein
MSLSIPFYFLLVVASAVLLTTAMRKLRKDDNEPAPPQENEAFERRIAKIEQKFGNAKGLPQERSDEGSPS